MRRDIIIVDNFYEDPDAVVRYARGLEYVYPYSQPGISAERRPRMWYTSRYRSADECPFKSSTALISRLQTLTGEIVDVRTWRLEFPVDENGYPRADHRTVYPKSAWWNCCFHVKLDVNQQLGAGVHSHTDHDSWNPVGLDGWAGLIYLNEAPPTHQGGLRTWDNRDPARQFDWMTPKENWQLRDSFANTYNRLILHRGRIPHSGSNGWGDSFDNGRFYQTLFFRTLGPCELPGLSTKELCIAR
jgi:hypothetical protein